MEVRYTEKHFEDPRDLPPDLAACQEQLYMNAQDKDIKRLFPQMQKGPTAKGGRNSTASNDPISTVGGTQI